jgi:hypothetical protein
MLKEGLLGDRLDCCRIWTAAASGSGTTLSSPLEDEEENVLVVRA